MKFTFRNILAFILLLNVAFLISCNDDVASEDEDKTEGFITLSDLEQLQKAKSGASDENKVILSATEQCLNSSTKPKNLSDLNDGYDVFYYFVEKNIAAKMGFIPMGAVGSLKHKSKILVYEFCQYRKDFCTVGSESIPIRWGVGVRLVLTIKSYKRKIELTNRYKLSAAVEQGKAEVTYKLSTFGLTGTPIKLSIPKLSGDFDKHANKEVTNAVNKIIAKMENTKTVVKPQLIMPQESAKNIKKKKKQGIF